MNKYLVATVSDGGNMHRCSDEYGSICKTSSCWEWWAAHIKP